MNNEERAKCKHPKVALKRQGIFCKVCGKRILVTQEDLDNDKR